MEQFSKAIKLSFLHDPNPRVFALINTELLASSGEHWMGIVMNKTQNAVAILTVLLEDLNG